MLKTVIDDYAATLNKAWSHDRSKTVGASEIGACARKTFWTKNKGTPKGVTEDEGWSDQWGARVRGTIIENAFWEPAMKAKYGDNLLASGLGQETLISGYLSATPDALVINQSRDALKALGIDDIESDCFMAECKTIDPRTNLVEAKTVNYFQVQVQIGLMRDKSPHKPIYNVLTYMDASFWSEVTEFPIKFDPTIYDAAKERATIIMTADSAVDLSPEGWIAGGKECSFCPYVKPCGVERRSVPQNSKAATPQFIAEIEDYCKDAIAAEIDMENAQKRLREKQQLIKDRLREKGVKRIQNVVNWYEVKGAERYSASKMKARLLKLGQDVEEFINVGEPTDRLVIAPIPGASSGVIQMPGILKAKKKKAKKSDGKSTATGKKRPRVLNRTGERKPLRKPKGSGKRKPHGK